MSIFEPAPPPWPSRMLSVLRIVVGVVFITFGTMKLFNYPPLPPGTPPFGLMSQAGIGGMLEVVGGLLIIVGLFTRPVAFVLSGEMAVAYFQFHYPQSFFPTTNMGTPAILYCFVFLYFVFAGAGEWSVDAMIARRRRGAQSPRVEKYA
jgi:putative oxidoreductase